MRPVPVARDKAEKSEGAIGGRVKLMPGHRWHMHQVKAVQRIDLTADDCFPSAVDDHDGMHVVVPFECRVSPRAYLEVAQFCGKVLRFTKKHLPRDIPEMRPDGLVMLQINVLPPASFRRLGTANRTCRLANGFF
jgi:hypothetical protein